MGDGYGGLSCQAWSCRHIVSEENRACSRTFFCPKNEAYLPGIAFPSDLQIGREIKPALMETDYLLLACPSFALQVTCESAKCHLSSSPVLKGGLILCKGLEPHSNQYAHEVMSDVFGESFYCGYLTGPSHALELAEGKPAAMCLAINSPMRKLGNYRKQ